MLTPISPSERIYEECLKVTACGKNWMDHAGCKSAPISNRSGYSVFYVQSGTLSYKINDVVTPVAEGCLMLVPPRVMQDHHFLEDENTLILWSHFRGTATALLSDIVTAKPVVIPVTDRIQLESVFEKTISAFYKESPFSQTVCAGYMTVLLALIAQNSLQNNDNLSSPRNENMERILSMMHAENSHPIDIKKYANICCISEDHFIRLFKAFTGLPPYHYQLKLRIERAQEMLEHTPISVTECAEIVGFGSIAHFSRVFKKFTGHPPSYYKKQ